MEIMSLIGLGIIAIALITLLKQYKPEYGLLISLCTGLLIFGVIAIKIVPIIDEIRDFFTMTSMPSSYIEVLLKSLGICFITELACDACKDAGEKAISGKLELAGKISVIAISLPLFQEVINIAVGLINS